MRAGLQFVITVVMGGTQRQRKLVSVAGETSNTLEWQGLLQKNRNIIWKRLLEVIKANLLVSLEL